MVLSIASLAWSSTHSNFCTMWQMAQQTALPYLQHSNVSTVAKPLLPGLQNRLHPRLTIGHNSAESFQYQHAPSAVQSMVHLFRQTIVDWQMYDGIAMARDNQRQERYSTV